LFGPASDVAYVLMDFIEAGKATAHPDHAGVTTSNRRCLAIY
jgi:hypothetical protein